MEVGGSKVQIQWDGWPGILPATIRPEGSTSTARQAFQYHDRRPRGESKRGCRRAGDVYNRGHRASSSRTSRAPGYLFQEQQLAFERADRPPNARVQEMNDATVADAGGRGGAQSANLNNVGANELFVANGFISADPEELLGFDVQDRRAKRATSSRRLNVAAFGTRGLAGTSGRAVYMNRGMVCWADVAAKSEYGHRTTDAPSRWRICRTGALGNCANQDSPACVTATARQCNPMERVLLGERVSNRARLAREVVLRVAGKKNSAAWWPADGIRSQKTVDSFGLGRARGDRGCAWPWCTRRCGPIPRRSNSHHHRAEKPV